VQANLSEIAIAEGLVRTDHRQTAENDDDEDEEDWETLSRYYLGLNGAKLRNVWEVLLSRKVIGRKGQENIVQGLPWVLVLSPEALKGTR
jgi:hypothetical protein